MPAAAVVERGATVRCCSARRTRLRRLAELGHGGVETVDQLGSGGAMSSRLRSTGRRPRRSCGRDGGGAAEPGEPASREHRDRDRLPCSSRCPVAHEQHRSGRHRVQRAAAGTNRRHRQRQTLRSAPTAARPHPTAENPRGNRGSRAHPGQHLLSIGLGTGRLGLVNHHCAWLSSLGWSGCEPQGSNEAAEDHQVRDRTVHRTALPAHWDSSE